MTTITQRAAEHMIAHCTPFKASHLWASEGFDGSFGRLPQEFRHSLGLQGASYVVFSYGTPIAWKLGDSWVLPIHSYSQSTTRHQNLVRRATS